MHMHYIQLQILHYRITTKRELNRMDILRQDTCSYCNEIETLEHLRYSCEKSYRLSIGTERWNHKMGLVNDVINVKHILV